jgi:hypothetical protein
MTADLVMNALLGLAAIIVGVSMIRFHRDPRYRKFNLLALISNRDGQPSRPAVMEFGAFVLFSWGFVTLMNRPTGVPEWYGIAYLGAFVARAAHSAYLRSKEETNGK